MKFKEIQTLLDAMVSKYNRPEFIPDDPIVIPHRFSLRQDIEISGFFAAMLAWGQRKTIVNKSTELMERMDNAPYDFVLNHTENDLKRLSGYCHRTFNDTDLLYFVSFFRRHYAKSESLESAFVNGHFTDMEAALTLFHEYFFDDEFAPQRTRKHVATPARKSACKRINMYLRWMVRKDNNGVDFGLWDSIPMSELICPCDLHVERVARSLGLITRKQVDWITAQELTSHLKEFDARDPVKYDFALFGLGIDQRYAGK